MPITTPNEMHRLFREAAHARDLERLATLYADNPVMAPQPGQAIRGNEAARRHLEQLLSMRPRFTNFVTTKVFEADDAALICSDWAAAATGPDGRPVEMQGRGTEVLRRQPDGNWLCVIDNPWGTDAG